MTVNNVNALPGYTAPQTAAKADQTGMRQDEITKGSFDRVMTKMGDTVRNLHAELAGTAAAAVSPAGDTAADLAKDTAQSADRTDAAVQKTDQTADKTAQDETDRTVGKDSDKTGDAAADDGGKAVEDADAKAAKTDETGRAEEAEEDVEKAAAQLIQDIADELDVTPEEVEKAMEAMGLVPVELFDISNLRQLMLTVAGNEDEVTLVTDEALYGSMKNLFAAVEENLGSLQEELGLDGVELKDLLAQIAAKSETPVQEDVQVQQMPEEVPEGAMDQKMPEAGLEGMKDYTVSVHQEGRTVRMKVTVDDADGSKSVQKEVTDVPKEAIPAGHKMMKEQQDPSRNERGDGGAAGNAAGNAFLQAMNRPAQAIGMPEPVVNSYQSVQTQEIMDQITDYMKINLKADVQEIEMQLHPASLGTVNVQIASKDGAVTAQFTTQNEAVRAVIETQLVQLKQQFEEQGIKVDAVEVMVADHEYGRQFSQENRDADNAQHRSSKGTRRINLDEIDEDEDLDQMEEPDRIAVEMMQANGNTVDYTA